jgi:hypothetical protein
MSNTPLSVIHITDLNSVPDPQSCLKSSFFDFLIDTKSEPELKKFILNQAQPAQPEKIPGVSAAA